MRANLLSVDRAALPDALLDVAKDHLRVRHDRDDTLIRMYVAQAIDVVERKGSINLNPSTFAIDPCALPGVAWPAQLWMPAGTMGVRLSLPVNNVEAFTVTDADGVDQSDAYEVEQADLGGSAQAYLVGPTIAAGWAMTADVGVDDPDKLAPAVLAVVLRLVGGYYETRESASDLTDDTFVDELVAVWRPSA
jgi:hypothetical protein